MHERNRLRLELFRTAIYDRSALIVRESVRSDEFDIVEEGDEVLVAVRDDLALHRTKVHRRVRRDDAQVVRHLVEIHGVVEDALGVHEAQLLDEVGHVDCQPVEGVLGKDLFAPVIRHQGRVSAEAPFASSGRRLRLAIFQSC